MLRKRKVQFLSIAVLIAVLPLTVFMTQRQQEIRQRAQVADESLKRGDMLTVKPSVVKPGDSVAVYWDLTGGVVGDPLAKVEVNPVSVKKGESIQVKFIYALAAPAVNDALVFIKQPPPCREGRACPDVMPTKVLTVYANSCKDTPGTTTNREGSCTISTQSFPSSGNYLVQLMKNPHSDVQNSTDLLASTSFTVTESDTQLVTLSVTPSSVPKGGAVTFQWKYNGLEPSPKDLIETFNSAGSHVADIYTSTCGPTEGTTVNTAGQCTHTTQAYIVGTFTAKFYRYGDRSEKYKMAETTFTVIAATAPTATPTLTPTPAAPPAPTAQAAFTCVNQSQIGAYVFHVLWPTSQTSITAVQLATNAQFTGEVFTSRNITTSGANYIVKGPGGFDLSGTSLQPYFRVGTTYYVRLVGNDSLTGPAVSITVPSCGGAHTLESAFKQLTKNIIPPAKAIAVYMPELTGKEYLELYRVEKKTGNLYATGPKMWLNCDYQTITDIVKPAPGNPIPSGKCQYEIPKDVKPDTYVVRILAADEKTVLAQSNYITVSNQPIEGCMSDADCGMNGSTVTKCMRYQNYPGSCQPENIACAQVVTRACRTVYNECHADSDQACAAWYSKEECVDFPNPCVVPPGWRTQPQATTKFNTNVQLTGIGAPSGNLTPKHSTRNFYLTLFDANNIPVTTQVGTLTFDAATGYFKGTIGYTYPYPSLCPPNADCAYDIKESITNSSPHDSGGQVRIAENTTRVTATYKAACVPRPACLDTQPACAVDLQPGQTLCPKSCNIDADCTGDQTGGTKCWKQGNYPGRCGKDACTANVVRACDPNTFCAEGTTCDRQPVCESFGAPCYVPPGWVIEEQTKPPSTSCPKPAIACLHGEVVIYGDPQDPNSCPKYRCLPPPNPVLNGSYTVKIWGPQFLRKQFPGIISIKDGDSITLPSLVMQAGDINGDNLINILDYNIILNCFGSKISSPSCKQSPHFPDAIGPLADLNDDGEVNGTDYNLFIKSLAIKEGD